MVILKPDVDYLMKLYEKLYSYNEDKINVSLNRSTKALHFGEIDRYPVWQVSQTTLYPRHELFYDHIKNLSTALAKNILSIEHNTDYVPFLDPFEGVTILAEALGCEIMVPENGDPVVAKPILRRPDDVYTLRKPNLHNPVFERVYETLTAWQEMTGREIPIATTDPQSPLDVAGQLWETNDFFASMYTNKKEVHYLLGLLTDTFIEFYSKQLEIIRNPAYPGHLFPLVRSNDGIAISDDEVILLSPELYREFGVPYLNRIAEHFGGLYYHSCGYFGDFMDDILSIHGLRAINGHLSPREFKPELINKVLSNKVGLFLGISDRDIGWPDPYWEPEEIDCLYFDYYLPSIIANSEGTGLVLIGMGGYRGYFEKIQNSQTAVTIDGRGRPVERDPLVNVFIEAKNSNFKRILARIIELQRMKEAGHDLCATEKYSRFSDQQQAYGKKK